MRNERDGLYRLKADAPTLNREWQRLPFFASEREHKPEIFFVGLRFSSIVKLTAFFTAPETFWRWNLFIFNPEKHYIIFGWQSYNKRFFLPQPLSCQRVIWKRVSKGESDTLCALLCKVDGATRETQRESASCSSPLFVRWKASALTGSVHASGAHKLRSLFSLSTSAASQRESVCATPSG